MPCLVPYSLVRASVLHLSRVPSLIAFAIYVVSITSSFITGMCENERGEAIVRSTIDLARHLDLRVVAEGIETPEVWERLTSLGCDTAQGYLISKPVDGEQLTAWLLRHADRPLAQAHIYK
jgi:EAL domain-containing protein (putative c-di-GMP-specific phosphodiesterase class I)